MTDLSTPANEIFSDSGTGIPVSRSISEIIHEFIIERMPQPGQPLADAAHHHFAAPGKMLRAKMALRAADFLKVDRSEIGRKRARLSTCAAFGIRIMTILCQLSTVSRWPASRLENSSAT